MKLINILLLFTFFKTVLSLSSYAATQQCNENILANNPPVITDLILEQGNVDFYQFGPQPNIPLTSQENAFWRVQTDQTIIFNFENTFEEQFWITAVAINEIPADPALVSDCYLNTDESETQLYAIRTIGEEGLADLKSVYNGDEVYSFRPVAEGVNVSVKVAVNPVLSRGIEITKFSNTNSNLPRCVRIDIYGCRLAETPLSYPTILFYNSPVTDNRISNRTSYSGICSSLSCTSGNGVLNDGIFGPFATIQDTIGFTNCSGCRITFFFSTLVSIETIIIEGMFEATLYEYPPLRVMILDEGVDKITYDPSNFTSDCFHTPDTYYCLIIGTEIESVSSVTIELESYLESSILLNEIEFYSNGNLLNFQTEQIDNGETVFIPPPIPTTIIPTNVQTPPPPQPPQNQNTETTFPSLPPTAIEDILALSSPSTIISILLCLTCTIISSVSIFLVTICWFFLIKYKLRYKAAKKELVRHKTTQDVLAKTNAVHSNQYPELVFEEFTDKSVIRPQMEVSANQMQAKPPLPNNHPPSNSYYTQERIYEAIPTQQKRHSKSSSIYEVEELNDYTLESYTNLHGHNTDTNPFSKASMTSSHGGDHNNLLPVREGGIKEDGYMSMSAAV